MPSLVNMTWDEVLAQYDDYNFIPTTRYSSEYEKNVVMDQSVMPGRTIKKNQEVEVVVSNGPKLVEIDDYSNKHYEDVITMLRKQDLKYEILRAENDDVAADFVIRTSPAAREWVEVGTTVTCYVSLGKSNESTAVPQMVNLSLASAEARAKEYDIILTVTYEPSSEVQEGHVIRQSIDATTIVEKNTIVEIVVSDGGEPTRESSISITVNQNATGEFEFKYYIDGTRQDDMTEIKDLALTGKIEWKFSNSGVHDYAIRVRSTATGAEGLFLNMSIDFTTDPPTKTQKEVNERVFRQLLSAAPAQTEEPDEPSDEETTAPDETTPEEDEPIPEETDDPYAEDPYWYGEDDEGTEGD